jgi:hypothetical protein
MNLSLGLMSHSAKVPWKNLENRKTKSLEAESGPIFITVTTGVREEETRQHADTPQWGVRLSWRCPSMWKNHDQAILFPGLSNAFSTAETAFVDRESPRGRLGGNGRASCERI